MSRHHRPWKRIDVPAAVRRIPSMLSHEELQYLMWVARDAAEGWGAVVDLGPWLGSSTVALAEGSRARGSKRAVSSFDLFQWEPSYMERIAPEGLPRGASFLPVFERWTAPWSDRIEARRADLHAIEWNQGPIEILFVDAAKSWDLLNAILRAFAPHLEPGRSRVILQDFRHFYTYWLPLVFDGSPELWTETESVEEGTTVTFTPRRRLDALGGVMPSYSDEDFPFDRAERILRARMDTESGGNRARVRLALYYLALLRGEAGVTKELLQDVRHEELLALTREADVRPSGSLTPGWEAFERGDLGTASRLTEEHAGGEAGSAEALLLLGRIAQESGRHERATALFHDALELLFRRHFVVPGWDTFAAGDLDATRRSVEEHIERQGESAEALFLLGRVAQERRELDVADDLFTRALELDPGHEYSRAFRRRLALTRGFMAFEAGDLETAQRLAEDYLEAHGELGEALFLLARIAQERRELARAEELYTQALALDPGHLYSRLFRADLAIDGERFEAAAHDLDAAIENLEPAHREPARMLCWLLHRLWRDPLQRPRIAAAAARLEPMFGELNELVRLANVVAGERCGPTGGALKAR